MPDTPAAFLAIALAGCLGGLVVLAGAFVVVRIIEHLASARRSTAPKEASGSWDPEYGHLDGSGDPTDPEWRT